MTSQNDVILSIEESKKTLLSVAAAFESASLSVALDFWERLLENSKSIILLLQKDFINEAMVIHRLSIEHFSIIVGLIKGKTTFEDLKNKTMIDIPKQAREIQMRDTKKPSLTLGNREALKDFLIRMDSDPVPSSGVSVYNLLDSCGLDFMYTNYRAYSIRAAHSTLLWGISVGSLDEVIKLLADVKAILDLTDAFANEFINSSKLAETS
jgi:hypothetical protein